MRAFSSACRAASAADNCHRQRKRSHEVSAKGSKRRHEATTSRKHRSATNAQPARHETATTEIGVHRADNANRLTEQEQEPASEHGLSQTEWVRLSRRPAWPAPCSARGSRPRRPAHPPRRPVSTRGTREGMLGTRRAGEEGAPTDAGSSTSSDETHRNELQALTYDHVANGNGTSGKQPSTKE